MKRFLVVSLSLFLLTAVALNAQTEDVGRNLSKKVPLSDTTSLNAANEILQKRYRPVDKQTAFGRVISDMYVWVHGSYYRPFVQYYGNGPLISAGIGKWFSNKDGLRRYHGVRLGASFGYFMDGFDANRVRWADVRASYLFDLSAYMAGYDPRRFVSVSAVAGVGYSFVEASTTAMNGRGISGHLGANLSFHLVPGLDLVIEPLFEIQQDPRNLVRQDIWRGYYTAFRGDVGLNLNLDGKYWRRYEDPGDDWRVSLAGGVRFQLAPTIIPGPDVNIGLSRRFHNWFYLRLQANLSRDKWLQNVNGDMEARNSSHYTFRMDAMADLVSLFSRDREKQRFLGVLLFAGPEAGVLHKDGIGNLDVFPYVGASGGLQIRGNINRNFALLLEPRVGIIPYYTHSNSREYSYANYYDLYSSLSLGVEYVLPFSRERAQAYSGGKGWFVSLYGNGRYPLTKAYCSGPWAYIAIGKWFNERWALRLGGEAGYNETTRRTIMGYGGKLSGLYNMLPEDSPFKLSVVGGAGVIVNHPRDVKGRVSPTAHVGLSWATRVLDGVDIVVEPLFSTQADLYQHSTIGFSMLHSIQGNVGMDIALEKSAYKTRQVINKQWTASVTGGVLWAYGQKGPGFTTALGMTREVNPVLDWRVQMAYGQDSKLRFISARLDAMVDLLYKRKTSLYILAGPDVGWKGTISSKKWLPYVGGSAGMEVNIPITAGFSAFAGARACFIPLPKDRVYYVFNGHLGVAYSWR